MGCATMSGEGVLAFEQEDSTTAPVSSQRLGELLSGTKVPLVMLEACRTAALSEQEVTGSVAPALLQSGVRSVVAFSHSVHVEAARLLVERFYREVMGGKSVGQALQEGRKRLHAVPARWTSRDPDADPLDLHDWFIPQLYQVGGDPVLIPSGSVPTPDPAAPPPLTPQEQVAQRMHGFPPEPLYRFHGRAPDLLHLERALRKAPAVLLAGMGGMGKTALAREAAHWWLRTRRYEAAVFVSFEQRPSVEQVVQTMGAALAGDDFSARPAEEQQRVVVQQFRQRRVLVVWDNYESVLPAFQQGDDPITSYSAEERREVERLYRALTEGDPSGRLLLTCRPATLELPRLRPDELGGLQRPDSLRLLQAVLEQRGVDIRRRPDYERPALDALLDLLDDHPLSVELVAPHLARHPPAHICAEFGALLDSFENTLPDEERNRSLRASLEFSKRHLSAAAQAVLPWLAWFSGGAFEDDILNLSEVDEQVWAAIRAELVNTALVRVEDVPGFKPPFIRLHPTLPYAARPDDVPDADAAELRFIAVYRAVMLESYKALLGSNPAFGMLLLHYEEANYRAAMRRAFRRGERQAGYALSDTLGVYLQMGGRQREQVALAAWVREQMGEAATLDAATCASLREHAGLFLQGQAQQAVDTVQSLLSRLEQGDLDDADDLPRQRALSYLYLGRILDHAGRPDLALEPLSQAVAGFEGLGESQQGNLAATLGDMANAYCNLGQHQQALAVAERGLAIDRARGGQRNIASGLGRIARILHEMQQYVAADQRYEEALKAAQQAGDRDLQASLLQNRGSLQNNMGHQEQAVALYKQALVLFQQSGDVGGEMRTSNLLGSAEHERGNLTAAEAWYLRARELAQQQGDQRQLANVAQNLGILYQERAKQEPDEAQRMDLLRQAAASVREALEIFQDMGNEPYVAASSFQLGTIHRLLGELATAEEYLHQGLHICEALNLPNVYKDYAQLAFVSRARGDATSAAQWWVKRDVKEAELVRRRGLGQRMPPLVRFEPLLRAIAAVTAGDETQRAEVEAAFPKMEAGAWGHIPPIVRRIWAGERSLDALTAGLSAEHTALVWRILCFIDDPSAPPLVPNADAPPPSPQPRPSPEQLIATLPQPVQDAIFKGDAAALQAAFAALPEEEQARVAAVVQALGGEE